MARILVVDDERSVRITLQAFLQEDGHDVVVAEDAGSALSLLEAEDFDVVVTDIVMPRMTGVDLLEAIGAVSPDVQVIIITGEPTVDTASAAVREGAFDYMSKPVTKETIQKRVRNAVKVKYLDDERRRLEEENRRHREELEQLVQERTGALWESERKYRQLVELAQEGIWGIDADGNTTFVNPSMAEMLGYNPEEMQGKHLSSFMDEQDAEAARKYLKRRREGIEEQHDFELLHRNGSRVYTLLDAAPLTDGDGNDIGAIAGVVDITGRRKVEEEARRLNEDLEERVHLRTAEIEKINEALKQAKKKADSANQAKSTFLANMSHEIRTPMNAILGFTEILDRRLTNNKDRQYLLYIQSASKSLLTLINDILDLAKIEAGKISIHYDAFDVRKTFREMEDIFSHKVSQNDIDFITEIDPELPPLVILDEVRLRQVLLNLLGNAIKFTDEGHIKLSVRCICADDDVDLMDLYFAVEDTGIGISKCQQERVFEAFEQDTGFSASKRGGTGLGLAITKRLVELMNGKIWVESEVGKGSTFHVLLHNVAFDGVEPESAETEAPFDPSLIRFEPAVILVADDVEMNRMLVKDYLEEYPFEILEAEDGEEMVRIATNCRPNLMLIDLKMPVLDGYEAAQQIKADNRTKGIPTVALTASVLQDRMSKTKKLFDGYITKPVSPADLVQELMRHLPHEVVSPMIAGPVEVKVEKSEVVHDRMEELCALLEAQLSLVETLLEAMTINEIDALGHEMKLLGAEYGYKPLQEWGNQLETQAQLFEVDKIKTTLEEFQCIVEGLHTLLKENSVSSRSL